MDAVKQQIEIATIKQALEGIQASIDEMKHQVDKVVAVSTSVAILEKRQDGHDEAIKASARRIDTIDEQLSSNTAYINKSRGGLGLAVGILGIVQAIVVAAAGWLIGTVMQTHEDVTVLKQHMRYLEIELSKPTGVTNELKP